ncbi:MAG: leucine-rich repeat protein [Sodaliphilus sp.]
MKKQLLFLFFALMALCASAAVGDNFTNGKLRYEVMSNGTSTDYGTVAVKGLSSEGASYSSLDLQIPGLVTYNGASYKVVKVWASAFNGSSNLTYVRMLYGMEDVSVAAFRNCTKLQSVQLPSSLKVIRKNAFENCSVLRSVYYANPTPDNSTIDETAFPNNSSMQLIVPLTDANSVENAKKVTAFNKFSNIYAHHQAFDFVFGNGAYCCVTKAPANKNVSGEFSIVGIDPLNLVFSPTSSSENVVGYKFNYATIADGAYASKSLKTVDLSKLDYLKMVGQSAFEDCKALTSVQLGTGLINIRPYAFRNCTSLTSIDLPASVRVCSAYFVDGCSNLHTINVNGGNNYFASYLGILYNKAQTELLRCPEGYSLTTLLTHDFYPTALKIIGPYAFENCKLIKEIYLPYGTTTIGRAAFNKCTALTTIQTPGTLTTIGEYAFSGTTALSKFFVNNTNPISIASDAFNDSKRTRLYCKRPTGYRAAKGWNTWNSVVYGGFDIMGQKDNSTSALRFSIHSNKPETVHGKAFDGRVTLTYMPPASSQNQEVRIPDEVVCRNGKKYAVTLIGSMVAPDILSKPYTLYLGTHIDTIGAGAFARDKSLVGLVSSINLKCIQTQAFCEAQYLKGDVKFHYGLKEVGNKAFYDTRVTGFEFPSSITTFGNDAIAECVVLEYMTFASTAEKIYTSTDWDFSGVPKDIPLYVTKDYGKKFEANEKWNKFEIIDRGANDFTRDAPNNEFYAMVVTSDKPVTKGGVTYDGEAKYVQKDTYWWLFASTCETGGLFKARLYEEDVDHLGNKKKYLMTALEANLLWAAKEKIKTVDLDDMKYLRSIGYGAFLKTGITKINIPSNCTYIGNWAFYNCNNLSEVFIGSDNACELGGQPFGNNASDFKCYVKSNTFSSYKNAFNNIIANGKWTFTEGDNIKPQERLRPYFRANDDYATTVSVDYPVDWNASGLKAYVVRDYDKSKNMAYTQRVTSTSAGTGLMVTGYTKGKVYKLQAPSGLPTTYSNLLVGSWSGPVEVYGMKVAYLLDSYGKCFQRPGSWTTLNAGYAYLKLSPTEAGNTKEIFIDLWPKTTGDINGDGEVNVSDVTALINKILGSSTYSDAVCDINGDGEINVSDVTALINLILE